MSTEAGYFSVDQEFGYSARLHQWMYKGHPVSAEEAAEIYTQKAAERERRTVSCSEQQAMTFIQNEVAQNAAVAADIQRAIATCNRALFSRIVDHLLYQLSLRVSDTGSFMALAYQWLSCAPTQAEDAEQ